MVDDPWLPVGYRIVDGVVCSVALSGASDWQLFETEDGGRALVAKEALARKWIQSGLIDDVALKPFSFGTAALRLLTSGQGHLLVPVDAAPSPSAKSEALSFAHSLRSARARAPTASFHDAIFVERYSTLLPQWSVSPAEPDDVVLGRYLSGGVRVSATSLRRLRTFLPWLGPPALEEILAASGIGRRVEAEADFQTVQAEQVPAEKKRFALPGRAQLENFFGEHVIDIIEHPERYRALGIEFPSAILLHGPPGCGKSFAIERLVEFLEWPSFSVDSSTIGSPYIHETGKKIAKVFDDALKAAPALVVIDEMDAFLSDRQSGAGQGLHHVEEVAEFLRRIPEAIRNQVLVIGMTNRVDAIDPAILRRGRFDHVIEVGMPSREEVQSLVSSLLSKLPIEPGLEASPVVDALVGRPLSDVSFAIREGARLAARGGRSSLDQKSLTDAVRMLPPVKKPNENTRRIGFGNS